MTSEPSPGAAGSGAPERHLTSAQEMRALTHPVRLALLEVLHMEGPMTATQAGEAIGESATTCSFHLRQLEKYGFVEEAGGGAGRRRPWRLVSRSMNFSGAGDAERSIAAGELAQLIFRRWLERYEAWSRVQDLDPAWAEVSGMAQSGNYLTLEEAAELRGEVLALFRRHAERVEDPSRRPAGARAVEMAFFLNPITGMPAEER
ncbi:MAG TPA: helix-turn-helix domain-containing protein [Acidimicrobiales bacterium]|nr:helix-turn-helix domain-containing protein [Acidimicrobiales bacterium]